MLNQNVTEQPANHNRIISTSVVETGSTEKQRRQSEQIKLFCQDTLACLSIFIATGAMLWILPLLQGASQ